MVGGEGSLFWKLTLLIVTFSFTHCVLNCVNLIEILEGLTLQIFVFVYVCFVLLLHLYCGFNLRKGKHNYI